MSDEPENRWLIKEGLLIKGLPFHICDRCRVYTSEKYGNGLCPNCHVAIGGLSTHIRRYDNRLKELEK